MAVVEEGEATMVAFRRSANGAGGVEREVFWAPKVSFNRPIGDRLVERGVREGEGEREAGSAVGG